MELDLQSLFELHVLCNIVHAAVLIGWDPATPPPPPAFGLIQGASGIDARFLKLSPASAFSPIMTKFSQYTPHSTCYLVLYSFAGKIKGPATGELESSHCQKNPRRMREDGE